MTCGPEDQFLLLGLPLFLGRGPGSTGCSFLASASGLVIPVTLTLQESYSLILRNQMTFNTWIQPLLDYYKDESIIFTDYIRPNKRGTFSVRNAPEAQARLGVSARYLYNIRNRIEAVAVLYEALVQSGIIT